jgi:hypothetical protein
MRADFIWTIDGKEFRERIWSREFRIPFSSFSAF